MGLKSPVPPVSESHVRPVQDVPGDDAMGGAEPGAELGEEDVRSYSQQQSFLFNETIAASIRKNRVKKGGWKCASVSG